MISVEDIQVPIDEFLSSTKQLGEFKQDVDNNKQDCAVLKK